MSDCIQGHQTIGITVKLCKIFIYFNPFPRERFWYHLRLSIGNALHTVYKGLLILI